MMSQPSAEPPSAPVVTTPARILSFAQVAAAANKPIVKKAPPPQVPAVPQVPRLVAKPPAKVVGKNTNGSLHENQLDVTVELAGQHTQDSHDGVEGIKQALEATRLTDHTMMTGTSQASMLRKDNSDTKSVASRTTLTLDEKDSLRPDDSASMQAAVEEDLPSPPSSVVANSKPSSDPDARAFRDQLRQIGLSGDQRVIMPRAQRPERLSVSAQPHNGLAFQVATPAETPPQQLDIIRPRVTDPQMWIMPPDEKLLEALASPKDRLFVLKVEQDLIDFIKDPKEDFLQLPGTNSFYRMLSHKLADYYMLGHIVDDTMNSVRIFKTASTRLPPPLISAVPGTTGHTPPPSGPARKIMRRNGKARTPDRAGADDAQFDSMDSSQATSEAGLHGDFGKESRPQTGKGGLSREERESRYNEVRARIFKGFEVKDDGKGVVPENNDVGLSRSSSTSGVKRNRKQKRPKDDNFEARSAFDQFGNRISESSYLQSPADAPMLGQYCFDANGQMVPAFADFQSGQEFTMNNYGMAGSNGQNMSATRGMPINSMQQEAFGMSSPTYSQNGYGPTSPGFENANYLQMMNQDRTPKGTVPSLSSYNQQYGSPEWSQNTYPDPYDMSNYQYSGFDNSYQQYFNGQAGPQMSQGGFNDFMQANAAAFNQNFYGNSFQNQHFNPQSQAFVPTAPMPYAQSRNLQQGTSLFMPNASGYNMQRQQNTTQAKHSNQQSNGHRGKNSKNNNTISKWPTPASLPAKPPQPTLRHEHSLPSKPITTR